MVKSLTLEYLNNRTDPGPKAARELIAPDDARALLDRNPSNRPLRVNQIARLARDMANGDWIEGSSTIAIAPDGRVLDGQHRLHALIESQSVLWFWVLRDVDPASYEVTDLGTPRHLTDFLYHRGEVNYHPLADATRVLYGWDVFGIAPGPNAIEWRARAPTMRQLLDFWDGHRDEIRAGYHLTRTTRAWKILPPSVASWAAILFTRLSATDAEDFLLRVAGRKVGAEQEGDPVRLLRVRLVRSREVAVERVPTRMAAALTIKAWNHYRAGTRIANLRWRQGGSEPEDFPTAR